MKQVQLANGIRSTSQSANGYKEYGVNLKTFCVPFDLKDIDDAM